VRVLLGASLRGTDRLLFNNPGLEGGVFAWLFLHVALLASDCLGYRYSVRRFVEPGRGHTLGDVLHVHQTRLF